jgi:hypothetical protein
MNAPMNATVLLGEDMVLRKLFAFRLSIVASFGFLEMKEFLPQVVSGIRVYERRCKRRDG